MMDETVSSRTIDPQQWVDAYADVLYGYALSRVGLSHLAEDLVQDTVLAALESRQTFRGDSQERTWLIGILRHKVLDHYRFVRHQREFQPARDDDGRDPMDVWFDEQGRWKRRPGAWSADSSQLMENQEFWAVFEHCMSNLPDRPRQVFAMKVMDDQDSKVICKELAISSTNFWVVLHRARALLRACLEKRWFSEK